MEALFAVFFMLLMFALPFGVVVAVILQGIKTQRVRQQTWQAIAAKLGLYYQVDRIWGYLDGQPVQCQIVVKGSGKNKQTWTVVSGTFRPGLDLGLSVSRQIAIFEALYRAFGGQDLEIGDPAFDQAFVIKGDEPARVAALLQPELRHLMQRCLPLAPQVVLNDRGFSLGIHSSAPAPAQIENDLHAVAAVTQLVQTIREQVPIAAPLAPYYESWASFARANGLRGIATPFCMWGEMDGVEVSVFAVRQSRLTYAAQIMVHFPEPLQHGLQVRPSGTMDELLSFFGGRDQRVGDQKFDNTFIVKANRVDRLSEIFDSQVREAMVRIYQSVGHVEVNDEGLSVRTPGFPQQPGGVPQLVNSVEEIAQRIYRNATQIYTVSAGPYR